jgi:hypothetical protein
MLVIDAKNERVAGWYASYGAVGAVPLLDAPLPLVLPLATIEAALKKAGNIARFRTRHLTRVKRPIRGFP